MALWCQKSTGAVAGIWLMLWNPTCRTEVRATEPPRAHLCTLLAAQPIADGRLVGFTIPLAANTLDPLKPETRRELLKLERSLASQRSVEALADRALIELAARKPDRSVSLLEQALALSPGRAEVLSDLAAVLLTRAAQACTPLDLVRALELTERAIAVAHGLPEVHFNNALALERLRLRHESSAAWEFYLKLDRRSAWSKLARTHLAALARETGPGWSERMESFPAALAAEPSQVNTLVERFPQQAREYAEGKLFGDWAKSETAGASTEAQRKFAALATVSKALADSGDDPLASDAVSAIERAVAHGREGLLPLVEGHRAYANALALSEKGKFAKAAGGFARARRLLASYNSPFAGWATYQLALCCFQHANYRGVRALLHPLIAAAANRRYRALLGRARQMLGLVAGIAGDPTVSRSSYVEALDDFQTIREVENQAKLLSLLAEADRLLGDDASLWLHVYQSLTTMRAGTPPEARLVPFEQAATAALAAGFPRAALDFQNEMVRAAAHIQHNPLPLSEALRIRARMLGANGRRRDALVDLNEALALTRDVPDASVRQSTECDVLMVRGEIEAETDPPRACADFDRAERLVTVTAYKYLLVPLFLNRARVRRSLGQLHLAERDLLTAAEEGERQRQEIPIGEVEHRATAADRLQAVFRALVRLALDRGDGVKALALADRGRALSLVDWLAANPSSGPSKTLPTASMAQIQQQLPRDITAIEYQILDNRAIAWVVTHQRPLSAPVELDARTLEALLRQLTAVTEVRGSDLDTITAQLYEVLIRPIESQLDASERLAFISDGFLSVVPFAALLNRRTGRFLAASHPVFIAPNLRMLQSRGAMSTTHGNLRTARALAVGDPRFSRSLFPQLPPLPEARAEVQELVQFLPGSRILVGEQATKNQFLALGGRYEIIHFAGHALVNDRFPSLSRLVFAAGSASREGGVLYASDILGRTWGKTSLVVLSGCRTGAAAGSHSEGIAALAWPFLAGGVRSVLVSLWNVGDQPTRTFFADFYRHLHESGDPLSALRGAQLDAISGDPSSTVWKSFELFGTS